MTAAERRILQKNWALIGRWFFHGWDLFVIPTMEDRATLLKYGWRGLKGFTDYDANALTPGAPYYGMLAQHETFGGLPISRIRQIIKGILAKQEADTNAGLAPKAN